jgi:GGDEF domain-containing protein
VARLVPGDRPVESDRTTTDGDQIEGDRDTLTADRGQSAKARLDAAGRRDELAGARDRVALSRDLAADVRDLAMRERDDASEQHDDACVVTRAEVVIRAAGQRRRAARHRVQAAQQRALAADDRHGAAEDREQAARERLRAHTDLDALADQLATVETDTVTGARSLAAGLTDLDHELDRCRATGSQLTVAYVEVVAIETLSDAHAPGASDALLTRVVAAISQQLRSFDFIVRLGEDEFLCAMPDMNMSDARNRLSQVAAALAGGPSAGAIRIGFAELETEDLTTALIARAEATSSVH